MSYFRELVILNFNCKCVYNYGHSFFLKMFLIHSLVL